MQELFKQKKTNRNVRNKYKLNLNISVVNQVNYGTKNLKSLKKLVVIWMGGGAGRKSLCQHMEEAIVV